MITISARPCSGEDAAPTDVTIEEIQKHWTGRREQFISLKVEWKESVTYPAGSFASPFNEAIPPEPHEDTVVQFSRSLLFDRGRLRTVDKGKYHFQGVREFVPTEITRVWNGREARALYDFEGASDRASISNDVEDAYEDAQLKPPMTACNLDVPYAIHLASYRIAGSTKHAGADVLVLKKLRPFEADSHAELWLKAKPPYLLLRALGYARGVQKSEFSWTYVDERGVGWRPSEWLKAWQDVPGGVLSRVSKAKVTSFEIRPDVDENEFQLEFPPGTVVMDERKP